MPKNIVVFSDGTGQDGGKGNNSNVYKLYNAIRDRSPDQIAFYDRGLGTGWRKITGNAMGMGISKNIHDCYEFIFDNYEAGDKIYLFGFSRGATTVRSLSSFIDLFGILPKARPELIKDAYKIYKIRKKEKRDRKAAAFIKKHHTMWASVEFLGVWDTVAALGLPFKSFNNLLDRIPLFRHKFQDLRLSESVKHAYQALAIDDERHIFHPTMWDIQNLKPYQTVKQVWFCGMHTDVGGGYAESALSDIPLEWMAAMAVKHGLKIHRKMALNGDPNGFMHDSRGTLLTKLLYWRKVRFMNPFFNGKATVHESVLMRRLSQDNEMDSRYGPWILDGSYDYDVEPWPGHSHERRVLLLPEPVDLPDSPSGVRQLAERAA